MIRFDHPRGGDPSRVARSCWKGIRMKRKHGAEPPRYTSPNKVMTVREVCAHLRVSRSTIYRLLKENQIPALRIGRKWRFNIEAIDRWCLRQKPDE